MIFQLKIGFAGVLSGHFTKSAIANFCALDIVKNFNRGVKRTRVSSAGSFQAYVFYILGEL